MGKVSFEQVYAQYYPRVYAKCLQMTRNPERAEEFTQDTFVQVLKNMKRFRGDCKITTWITRIAMNEVLMDKRKRYHKAEVPLLKLRQFHEEEDRFHDLPVRDDVLEGVPAYIDIERQLSALNLQFRQAVILKDLLGWKSHEIAKALGSTTGTIKSRIHRGRGQMTRSMTQ